MAHYQQIGRPVSRETLLRGAAARGAIATLGYLGVDAQHADAAAIAASGVVREYWVQVDSFRHNLVPTGLDAMMGTHYTPLQSSYWALGYRAFTPGWKEPLPASSSIGLNSGIPGPILRANVGDTLRVHFRNNDRYYRYPHSMHPHGVRYKPEFDGAWTAADPHKPGAAVKPGESYTYEWVARPNSVGTWPYHDHSIPPMVLPPGIGHNNKKTGGIDLDQADMEVSALLGMFGFVVVADHTAPPDDKEFFVFLHDLYQAVIPALSQDYDCISGYAYMGNTPTFKARVGDRIRWRVATLGKEFHAFHVHGHRWYYNGRWDDTLVMGPATTVTFEYVEDEPGDWLYHCHVTDHMTGGMLGHYIVTV